MVEKEMITAVLLLIFTGPWLVYLVVPVPDQLAEYRNYSMVAGFALLASLLPWILWTPLLAYCVGLAHAHAMAYADPIAFWRAAVQHTSGDRSRATQEVGAFLKIGGKNAEAEPYFEEALRLNPNLAPAMENLASIYFQTGRLEKSYALVERMVERCPQYAMGWQTRGILQEQRGNDVEARRSYENALALSSLLPQSMNHLGLIAFREQRFEDALVWFRKAQPLHPNEVTFQYNEAMALFALGRTDDANAIRDRYNGIPIQWTPEMIPPPQQKTA